MNRTATRLIGFGVLLAALFTGGWAAGQQFPVDDDPTPHEQPHGTDHGSDVGSEPGHESATETP